VANSPAEEGGDVARTLRHRHDLSRPAIGAVDDEVGADRLVEIEVRIGAE
jgi:hypothetical protein